MFALHVTRGMHPDMFLEGEWDFLIGLLVEAGTEEAGGRAPSWLEAERGSDTSRLLATFPTLAANLQLDEGGVWGAFMKAETPEKDLPAQVREVCGKSKWKFLMAFAIGGGGLEGVSSATYLF